MKLWDGIGKMNDEELLLGAKSGNRRNLSKLLSRIENGKFSFDKHSDVWALGVTGPPGVGKSTLIGKLIERWTAAGEKVAVLAVDPSSPVSGGAILGDRLRMTNSDIGESVFVRSLATRNHPGGIIPNISDMINLFSYCGWSRIIIETVGSGQSEIGVIALANRILLVDGPDRGDMIQAEKAGIMEMADIIVVNKSDLPRAKLTADLISESLSLGSVDSIPVFVTSALENKGIDDLVVCLDSLVPNESRKNLRIRQTLLSHWTSLAISNPQFDKIIIDISNGSKSISESIMSLIELIQNEVKT